MLSHPKMNNRIYYKYKFIFIVVLVCVVCVHAE